MERAQRVAISLRSAAAVFVHSAMCWTRNLGASLALKSCPLGRLPVRQVHWSSRRKDTWDFLSLAIVNCKGG